MTDPNYSIPDSPEYKARSIRALQDNALADACRTFNPVFAGILESVEYVHRQTLRAKILLPGSGWQEEEGGGASYDLPVAGVTADMAPSVTLSPGSLEAAKACELSGTCEALDGAVRFWAKAPPETALEGELLLVLPGQNLAAPEGETAGGSAEELGDLTPELGTYGPVNVPGASRNDLEQAGGLVAQPEPPENVKKGWIDTGSHSVLKYYDPETETWKPVGAVWS